MKKFYQRIVINQMTRINQKIKMSHVINMYQMMNTSQITNMNWMRNIGDYDMTSGYQSQLPGLEVLIFSSNKPSLGRPGYTG